MCTTTTEIELWCNGNTTDSGPVIPGSNPSSSTKKREVIGLSFYFANCSLIGIYEFE